MIKRAILSCISLIFLLQGFAQRNDGKPVVGVSKFTSEVDSKFCSAVSEKIVEIVTETKRFTVVDRTSYDKVREELELQKSEAFMDSKSTVKQDAALAAQFIIIGHIIKLSVFAMRNGDNSIKGYKASTAFTLKVNDVESGKTNEAESFQTDVSPMMLSPESAVNESLKSIEDDLATYFIKNFPVVTKIKKILTTDNNAAETVLIGGGKSYGFHEGDRLTVERIEMIDGEPYPTQIGELVITKIAGDSFSECSVKKGGEEIMSRFQAAEKINCKLVVK